MHPSQIYQYIFEEIGTHWVIDIYNAPKDFNFENLKSLIRKRIQIFDNTYSRFKDNTLVTEISKKAGVYPTPKDAIPLLNIYKKIYFLTEGLFTPLIGKTLEQAGYDKNYSLTPKNISTPLTWQESLSYNSQNITVTKPSLLDFGAAGKGYLVDIIGHLLENQGIKNFCIDASGDITYKNQNGNFLEIGLEDPNNPNRVVGIATISNMSICGSAGNRRKWANFHHIINPKTLSSPRNILATWVITKDTITADALSTALFLCPPETFNNHFDLEYLILNQDYSIKKSPNFPATLF